jgi:hypothetical protein
LLKVAQLGLTSVNSALPALIGVLKLLSNTENRLLSAVGM